MYRGAAHGGGCVDGNHRDPTRTQHQERMRYHESILVLMGFLLNRVGGTLAATKKMGCIDSQCMSCARLVLELNETGDFDAYISCSTDNIRRVVELLEGVQARDSGLRLCLPQRDLLGHVALPIITPDLITVRSEFKTHAARFVFLIGVFPEAREVTRKFSFSQLC